MKFTKQETSMIKVAAAFVAPQMIKKATLQEKLAEYGIGLKKQAAGPDLKYQGPDPRAQASSFAVMDETKDKDPMYFGGTPYTDAMRAKYAEIMNNDAWKKFKWRQERAQNAAEGARFAVGELKQNPLGFRSGSPFRPGAFSGRRPMYSPAYSDKLLKAIWRSAGSPDLWHRNEQAAAE